MIDVERVTAAVCLSQNILTISQVARTDAEFDNLLWHALEVYGRDIERIRQRERPFTVIDGGAT
jgi:hypothetical protein